MISELTWDTSFWGIKTGKILLHDKLTIDLVEFNKFKFIYIFSNRKLLHEELKVGRGKIHLADEKIVYHKHLEITSFLPDKIHSFDATRTIPDRLYELAIQSGHYSRFSTDPNISRSSFENLYKIWLERSISRDIADEVFVYETDDLVRGFITLGIKSGRPDIGLVAVNAKDRSLGIGALLLQAAENWALTQKNSHEIQVVTQGENKGACRFYEKNGYSIDSVTYIYHWWNK